MSPPVAPSRDLLFGLLALQNGLINQVQLVAAFQAWTLDKARALADHLIALGHLNGAQKAVVEAMADLHVAKQGDVERSLAAIPAGRSTHESLARLGDPDINATLTHARPRSTQPDGEADADRTPTYSVGTATSDGLRFRVLRPHARGGLGAVFVALDQELHREVALKQILDSHADDPTSRQRFLLEAEVTGGLEHPGIVPVYGLGSYGDGRPYYAMRFIRGDSLKEAIARFHTDEALKTDPGRRSLELRKLLRRFLDVCNAIDYAHSRGVLHRDIKPGNIIVGRYGETLVVDWGLAKARGQGAGPSEEPPLAPSSASGSAETLPGSTLGTPAYMSPEQARGDLDSLGPRSDVYSLGGTLYCLLTGKPPQEGGDLGEVLRKVQRGEFTPPRQLDPSIDQALEAVCLKAMAPNPEDRYASGRALAEEIERWMADEPVSAWREPLYRRARRWGRRHRLLVTGLAATLIVAVGALAVGTVLVAHQRDRAEGNLAFARKVVDEMYTGVAAKLDDQVQMDDYQREILEKALRFYERFALPQSRDPQVRLEAAKAGMRVGGIRSRLGETAAAEEAYRQALGILSRLMADHPVDLDDRDALAQAHHELGAVFRTEERWVESEREIKEEMAVWNALAHEQPELAAYRSKLADAHGSLGNLYMLQSRNEEAEREFRLALEAADRLARESPKVVTYQESLERILSPYAALQYRRNDLAGSEAARERAVAIMDNLARRDPEVTKHQFGLGRNLASLGQTFYAERKFPQAEEALRRSIAIQERLTADHPRDMEIAAALGSTYMNMSEVLVLRGDGQSAMEWSDRATRLYRSLGRRDPGNLSIGRTQLWTTIANRAETLMRLGRHAEAIANFEEVLRLTHGTKSSELFRAFRALSKARLGDLSALVLVGNEVRDTLIAGHEGSPVYHYWMNYYDAACLHAALAKLALQDQGKPPAERQRLSQRDLELTLDLLDRMRLPGEYKEGIPLDEIRRERLLDPLRSHPRFQLLMMDLAMPSDPFSKDTDADR